MCVVDVGGTRSSNELRGGRNVWVRETRRVALRGVWTVHGFQLHVCAGVSVAMAFSYIDVFFQLVHEPRFEHRAQIVEL